MLCTQNAEHEISTRQQIVTVLRQMHTVILAWYRVSAILLII